MKIVSGAVLFFVLLGSNPQAFSRPGKESGQPDGATIMGFRDVAAE